LGADLRNFAAQIWQGSRPLALLTAGSAALLAVSLVLQLVDPRQVLGAPTWMKPAKFAISVAVAAPVLAWIMGQLGGSARRGLRLGGAIMAGTAALELVIITGQAARGVSSHFNAATSADIALFAVMGIAITIFWLAQGYVALLSLRHRFASPARTWAIRLGLVAALLGGALGFLMPRPTPAQLATLRAGQPTLHLGAHAVGVPDGGPGLPLTRWSTEGGDLRVPHFFGLHALQALPLFAWVLERRRRRRDGAAAAARPVIALGVGWIGFILVTLWQALRAQPLLAPDAATLAGAALVLAAALAVALVQGTGRSTSPRSRISSSPAMRPASTVTSKLPAGSATRPSDTGAPAVLATVPASDCPPSLTTNWPPAEPSSAS
jgi:hypothetical protein